MHNLHRKITYYTVLLFAFCFTSVHVAAQDNYVLLPDASGFDRSGYESTVSNYADDIALTLSLEGLDVKFKVFDFGFYLHNSVTSGGIDEALQTGVQFADNYNPTVDSYILIAKETNAEGVYKKIHLILNIDQLSSCIDQAEIDLIELYINSFQYSGNPYEIDVYISNVLNSLNKKLNKFINCDCTNLKEDTTKKSVLTCDDYYTEDDLIFLAQTLPEGAVIYCKRCELNGTPTENSYFFRLDDENIYRCIIGEYLNGDLILYSQGLDDFFFGQLPPEVQDMNIGGIQNDLLIYEEKICYPDVDEDEYCGETWQLNVGFKDKIEDSIFDCFFLSLNEQNLDGGITGQISSSSAIENELVDMPSWLSANGYNSAYYFYDQVEKTLTKVDNSGILSTQDVNQMSLWAQEFADQNYTGGANQSFWLDIDAFGNVRINGQINRETITIANVYNDSQNKDVAIEIFEQAGMDILASNSNFDELTVEPGSTQSDNPDVGEVEVRAGSFLKWPTFIYEEGRYVVVNGKLNEGLWLEPEDPYDHKLATTGKVVSGATDAFIIEYKDLVETAKGVAGFVKAPRQTLTDLHEGLKSISIDGLKKAFDSQIDLLTHEGPRQYYEVTKVGTKTVLVVMTIYKSGLFAIVKKVDDLTQLFAKIGNWMGDAAKSTWNGLSDARKKLFAEDFLDKINLDDIDLIDVLSSGDAIKAWQSFLDEGFDALRKNLDAVKALKDSIEEGLDGMDAIKDAIQTLNKNKWQEIKALFKRGNDFNRKARDNSWWPEAEVTVVHPTKVYPSGHNLAGQPRRFRLDSYDHNLGKRVSRKATDFDQITEQTFKNYLSEIDSKYPEGAVIKRPGSPLNDKVLHGEKILEVPDSNIGSAKQAAFEQLAADKNVTVVYKPE